jgi:hypothetical protein
LGGNASLNYCKISHASTAINEECCGGGTDEIKNSTFTFNEIALDGYTGILTIVENCYFANNEKCITHADKVVNHCIFENNEYGLYETERISVSNSTFTNHSKIALYGGRGKLTNSIVTDNNIGVRAFFEGFEIEDCDISNNQVGVELNDYDRYVSPVTNCTICHNKLYNVKNYSKCDVDLYDNCWCTADSTTVENLIYDAFDDINVGFVNYTLFTEDCSRAIFKTHKAEGYTEYLSVQDVEINKITIYPNPTNGQLRVRSYKLQEGDYHIFNTMGQIVMQGRLQGETTTINAESFTNGMYYLRIADKAVKFVRE